MNTVMDLDFSIANKIIEVAQVIPTLTDINERQLLSNLAQQVNNDSAIIVEVGALYGGVTAVLALSAPLANITTMDNFSWHPPGYPVTSKGLLERNMIDLNISNVTVMEGDSRRLGKRFPYKIDLLWIDGGHSYEYVYSDLINLGVNSNVIALHDYDNPAWPSIRQAVEVFIGKYSPFCVDIVVGTVVVLRRK